MNNRIGTLIFTLVAAVLLTIAGFTMFVTVGADEIVVKQGAIDGKLDVWTDPGVHCRCFGSITKYKRSSTFWFSQKNDEGKDDKAAVADESIKVRFNDGGHAQLSGSIRYDLPLDYDHVVLLHKTYHSRVAVEHELVRQVITKSVYMTGPLMSSKESAAERRPDLMRYIEDQVAHGVYRTVTKPMKVIDALSGQEKTVSVVEIIADPKAYGGAQREEISPLETYGIRTSNGALNSIAYDGDVEAQIKAQQKALMDVQTAQAEARKAEQAAITAQKQGEAKAAEAKWGQEAEKAKAVTLAEQQRDVAKLELEKTQLDKQANIAEGEGQAKKAQLLMGANGALEQKLAAWVDVNKAYAAEIGKQKWVPDVQMGASAAGSSTGIMDLFMAKTARDLGIEMKMGGKGAEPAKAGGK